MHTPTPTPTTTIDDLLAERQTIIIDPDTVTVVLTDAEHTREFSRAAIDEIANRVEAELELRGIEGVDVEREYRTTGRHDDSSVFHAVFDAVLIYQVDEIRAAIGLDGEPS